jgi:hypothetical protein
LSLGFKPGARHAADGPGLKRLDFAGYGDYNMGMGKHKSKPKMGRPALPPGASRTKQRAVRLTPSELTRIERAARRAGLPVTAFMRQGALELLERCEHEGGHE